MNDPAASQTPPAPGIRGSVLAVVVVLAVAAAGLSAYLTYASMAADGPVGCGTGAGCAEVLGSPWSKVLGLPVSLLALLAYAVLLVAALTTRAGGEALRRLAWLGCTIAAAAILGSGAWFTYVQAVKINTWCPYCLAAHGLGAALVTMVLACFVRGRALHAWPGLPLGVAMVTVLAIAQVRTPPEVYRVALPDAGDFEITDDYSRRIGLIGGRLKLDLNHEPVIGSPDAKVVIVTMFDFGCPHCQRAHEAMETVLAESPGDAAFLLMPIPLNNKCNPAVLYEHERFAASCERSKLLYAVQLAGPAKVAAFDKWMFEVPRGGFRSGDEARAKAEELVGADALAQALANPDLDLLIKRNNQAYLAAQAGRVPAALAPGTSIVYGDSLGEPEVLRALIDEAVAKRPVTGDAPSANP